MIALAKESEPMQVEVAVIHLKYKGKGGINNESTNHHILKG